MLFLGTLPTWVSVSLCGHLGIESTTIDSRSWTGVVWTLPGVHLIRTGTMRACMCEQLCVFILMCLLGFPAYLVTWCSRRCTLIMFSVFIMVSCDHLSHCTYRNWAMLCKCTFQNVPCLERVSLLIGQTDETQAAGHWSMSSWTGMRPPVRLHSFLSRWFLAVVFSQWKCCSTDSKSARLTICVFLMNDSYIIIYVNNIWLYRCEKPNKMHWINMHYWWSDTLKGIVHPKMNILSSFTHPHVVLNLYEFLSYVEHKRRYFEECW